MHPARISIEKLLEDCQVARTRRGGPGGQHRNKVETAVVITHRPTGTTGQAGERRSQHANREMAIERLRLNLAVEIRSPVAEGQTPSQLWNSRIRGGILSVSVSHRDFPGLLAEALDIIVDCEFDVVEAARRLCVSTTQLIKLLRQHRPALEFVNHERLQRGMSRLR